MTRYIALLRGINVGGRNMLPMQTLTAILEDLGCRSVRTYIQSGNAVLESDEDDPARLFTAISTKIAERCGFEPPVLLLRLDELEAAIAANPFPEAESDPKTLHAGFLATAPKAPDLGALERLRRPSESFRLIGTVFYLHAPEGVGRSKLAASAERLLGVPMTDRNWRTVCKIRDMARE